MILVESFRGGWGVLTIVGGRCPLTCGSFHSTCHPAVNEWGQTGVCLSLSLSLCGCGCVCVCVCVCVLSLDQQEIWTQAPMTCGVVSGDKMDAMKMKYYQNHTQKQLLVSD